MRFLLTALLVAVLAVPSMAAIFTSTNSGSFDIYNGEGYTNGGGDPAPRMGGGGGGGRANMGWTSFSGSQAALADLLTANPNATATLYVAYAGANHAGTYYLESLRSGNAGAIVSDQGYSSGYDYTSPAPGIVGSSSPIAFRTCPLDGTSGGYAAPGNGIATNQTYRNRDGVAWTTPYSFDTPYGTVPARANNSGPNNDAAKRPERSAIIYDTGVSVGQPATSKYIGYLNNGSGSPGLYAIEDLLGIWGDEGRQGNQSLANVKSAGQILNGQNADGSGTPTLFGAANIISGGDPAGLGLPDGSAGWLAIDLSPVMLYELAFDPQMKGLVFAQNLPGTTVDGGWEFFANGSGIAPYLVVSPEPTTLVLLAIGGLLGMRRRQTV